MGPIFEFPITLPAPGSRERLRSLHTQLRAAILDGRLQPGLRLPATRELAAAFAISRNTAVAAYDLLLSEGYVLARPGAGNYVADVLTRRPITRVADDSATAERRLAPHWRHAPDMKPTLPVITYRDNFTVGVPDISQFPFDVWRRLSARALRQLSKAPIGYDMPNGRLGLRKAIARHVSFTRAVACSDGDIVVTSGAQQAFDLLARVLVTPGRTVVAIEDPGYPHAYAAFAAAGAQVTGVPVDGEGLVVDKLPSNARVIYVTPSHQFPLGVPMSPRRRAALLAFAQKHRAVVIEDDYDSEFRYGNRPLDALQTLDRSGSVCYVGTFSKCLFPALRIGYVVAPPWLQAPLVAAKKVADWHGDILAQDTLAAFIDDGHLVRHVRRMRKVYAHRREVLLDALQRHGAGRWPAFPSEAGLHLAVRIPCSIKKNGVIARAAERGIRLESLHDYAQGRSTPEGLVLGFGAIEAERIDPAVRLLAKCLDG